jgi:hypothetical protein
MQALDNFISPIPDFYGDIPIPVVPVLARPPGDEPVSDPSAGASVSALKTWVGKRKATAKSTPPKKTRKPTGRSVGRINPLPKLLLRLLHRVLGGRSRSSVQKGTLITSVFPP